METARFVDLPLRHVKRVLIDNEDKHNTVGRELHVLLHWGVFRYCMYRYVVLYILQYTVEVLYFALSLQCVYVGIWSKTHI